MAASVPATLFATAPPDSISSFKLPPVKKAPWRFKKFPLIAWWGPPGTAPQKAFDDYRDAGFNLYLANSDIGTSQALEKAKAAGLAIMGFPGGGGFGLKRRHVDFPQDDPSIVAWLITDEPSGVEGVENAITAMNTQMRRDPTRYAFYNMLPPSAMRDPSTTEAIKAAVENGLPILSYDAYVIYKNGNTNPENQFRFLEIYREASVQYDVPLWAFALTISHFNYRRPSESDYRWNQYTSLAYGAKGLWCFTYWGPTEDKRNWDKWDNRAIVNPATGRKTKLWHQVKAVNDTVSAVGDTLLKLKSVGVAHTSEPLVDRPFKPGKWWISDIKAQNALLGFFVDPAGKKYAWVMNKQHGAKSSAADLADTMTLTFAPDVKKVTALSWLDGTPGHIAIDKNHQATLKIAGGTGVLIRVD